MAMSGRAPILGLVAWTAVELFAASAEKISPGDVQVYRIEVAVNRSEVIQLPRRALRVAVTQPKIAEAVVVAPDQILVHGRSVGTTSLVVWLEPEK
jgi:Flp pilus assembly secretin CpaC